MSKLVDPHPKFIPSWTKVVVENIDVDWDDTSAIDKIQPDGHSITSMSCCLVGEAHGFNDDYSRSARKHCKVCNEEAYTILTVLLKHSVEAFYAWKHRLYLHVKAKHPELLRRKK